MQKILIIDSGSQYTQLIARRVRELHVYCEIYPYNHAPDLDAETVGVIYSGSPASVHEKDAPVLPLEKYSTVPVLAVCYGAQYYAKAGGGSVVRSEIREYGRAILNYVDASNPLFNGISSGSQVWMSHGDTIESLPANAVCIASTDSVKNAAYAIPEMNTWAIQFHPEVTHSLDGKKLLHNFVVTLCGCRQDWTSESFIQSTLDELRSKLGNERVVMGLSGGVYS